MDLALLGAALFISIVNLIVSNKLIKTLDEIEYKELDDYEELLKKLDDYKE